MIPASVQAVLDRIYASKMPTINNDEIRALIALAVQETAREIADFSERYNSGTFLGAVIRAKYGVTK